jgi:tetratricopeptide (TPR) repeat protein
MGKSTIVLLLIFFISLQAFAQSDSVQRIDSLKQVLQKPMGKKQRIQTLIAMTEACYGGAPTASIEYVKEAAKLSLEINYPDGLSSAYGWLAFLYEQEGKIKTALDYNFKAFDIAKKIKNKKDQATILNNIAAIYKDQGKIIEALEMHQQSLRINTEIGNKNGIATSYNNIGLIYAGQGKITEALDYYAHALKMSEELENAEGITTALQNIAIVYKDQHEYQKAREYLLRALKINLEAGDKYSIGYTYNSLGLLNDEMGNRTAALDYLNKALAVRREINDSQGMAHSLKNIGNLYKKSGNIGFAENAFKESLGNFEILGDRFGVTVVTNLLGEIMIAKGFSNDAEKYFNRSLQLAQKLGYPLNISDAAKNLQQLYRAQSQWQKALVMNDVYIQMRDSIKNTNNRTAAIRAQFKYDYEKKNRDEKIAKIKKEAHEARTRNIQYASIALGILVFIVLFLLLSHTIVATPKMIQFVGVVTLLIVFEFVNLLLHPFLHDITHHSTLLMLLAMVCLAAVMVPMHHKIEHWATHTLIEKNKKIRLANAKRTIEELEEQPIAIEDANNETS